MTHHTHSMEYYERFQKAYGAVVKELRKRKEWSRERLARQADISYATLYKIEQGKANPMLTTMDNIAKALRTSVSRMFGLTEKRLSEETEK
jgi:DNA-binding XRE family transcriptional regulator